MSQLKKWRMQVADDSSCTIIGHDKRGYKQERWQTFYVQIQRHMLVAANDPNKDTQEGSS